MNDYPTFTLADLAGGLCVVCAVLVILLDCGRALAVDPSTAIAHCPFGKHIKNDPHRAARVVALFEIERKAGVPRQVVGLLAAAACSESGYIADPGRGDGGASVGILQFVAWFKKRIRLYSNTKGDPRLDWRASAMFWIAHVKRQLPRVRKHCKGRGGYGSRTLYLWASANTSAVRYPRCKRRNPTTGRCVAFLPRCARRGRLSETNHLKVLRAWKRIEAKAVRR